MNDSHHTGRHTFLTIAFIITLIFIFVAIGRAIAYSEEQSRLKEHEERQ